MPLPRPVVITAVTIAALLTSALVGGLVTRALTPPPLPAAESAVALAAEAAEEGPFPPDEPDEPADPAPPSPAATEDLALAQAQVDATTASEGVIGLVSSEDPQGTTATIALRFLQAVQRGDDLLAARQLGWQERLRLSRTDPWVLARVMADVRRHARLDGRSPCRHARPYDERSVLVACGRVRVLVRVEPDWMAGNGVLVLAGVPKDAYRHAHTFAFSTVPV